MSESDEKLRIYEKICLIRKVEERLMAEYSQQEMKCPMHFCIGQEALPAVLSLLLRTDDTLMCPHRSHGFYLAKNAPLEAMVAEFYGRLTGASRGMAGSQELSHGPSNFYSGAILAGAFAISVGSAFAAKFTGADSLSVGLVGDGGMEEGVVFEAMNLAAVHNLPVLFICENNLYSAHTPSQPYRSRHNHFFARAESFGVKAVLLDGYDPLGLLHRLDGLIRGIRQGSGPIFAEVTTYRTCGHVGIENDLYLDYRTAEEVEVWRSRDPLPVMRHLVRQSGVAERDVLNLEARIDQDIDAALSAAKSAPYPSFEDVLAWNLDGSFHPAVRSLIDGPVSDFNPQQAESKIKAY